METEREEVQSLLEWTICFCKKLEIEPDAKYRGQHFLVDKRVRDQLVSRVPELPAIEIGPGLGVLTELLAKKGPPIAAIEIDPRFKPALFSLQERYSRLSVAFTNVLRVNFREKARKLGADDEGVWLVGALPYQLVEPLMLKLARKSEERAVVAGATFLVSERSAAEMISKRPPRTKLAILTTSLFEPQLVEKGIGKESFWPQPRTRSAIIEFVRRDSRELLASPSNFIWLYLFGHPKAKVKNALREALVAFSEERERASSLDKRSSNRRERRRVRSELRSARGLVGEIIAEYEEPEKASGRSLTKSQARDIMRQLQPPGRVLELTVEQLNNSELSLLDKALLDYYRISR